MRSIPRNICILLTLFFLIPFLAVQGQALADVQKPDFSDDPFAQVQPNDITHSASGAYYFTTFEDLEEILAKDNDPYLSLDYDGDTDLVIKRSIYLPDNSFLKVDWTKLIVPEGVSFHAGRLQTDGLQIDGTMSFSDSITCLGPLTVNGTLLAPADGYIGVDGYMLSGEDNIVGYDYYLNCSYDIFSEDELFSLIEKANNCTNDNFHYYLNVTGDQLSFISIDRDLTIPQNTTVVFRNDEICIENNITVTVNGFVSFPDLTVNGTILNNSETRLSTGFTTFHTDKAYLGTGKLVLFADENKTYEDHISGLDFSSFRIRTEHMYRTTYYELRIPPCLEHSYSNGICIQCRSSESADTINTLNGVSRIAGAGRVETALGAADLLKETLGINRFDNIIVTNAKNFPDALAGSYLAADKKAPILLTMDGYHDKVIEYIRSNLTLTGQIYILGGYTAVSEYFTDRLESITTNVVRFAGVDRFDTNLMILNEVGMGAQPLLVCTAYGFADSLSISATGYPVLLVGDSLSTTQKEFLGNLDLDEVYIIGGSAAVSSQVEEELKLYANSVQRLSGKDRHQTSILVAMEFFPNSGNAILAYSQNFPDGLSGGPLSYCLRAPLLLTQTGNTSCLSYCHNNNIQNGCIMGSDELIDDTTARTIFSMSYNAPITVR